MHGISWMFSILLQTAMGLLNCLIWVVHFLTTLIVHSTKRVYETYWCSSSIACQRKRKDWILRIFTFNDKNPPYLPISLTQRLIFLGSKWSRSNPISHKTIWHIEFKIKKMPVFPSPLWFFVYFFRQYLTQILRPIPFPHYQWCLQVSETVSWHKFWRCYSANILQHWVGGSGLIYFWKVDHSRVSRDFSRNWLGLNNLCETL